MGGKPNRGTKRDRRLKANKAGKASTGKRAFPGAAMPFGKRRKKG